MSGLKITTSELLKKIEEANFYINHQSTRQNWSTVYIKEELLSPDENQNNGSVDPLKVVKQEVDETADDLASSDHQATPTPSPISTDPLTSDRKLSGSNSELREIMAAAQATLFYPEGEANFLSLCNDAPSYPNTADDYSARYNVPLCPDDKTIHGYGANNLQYSNTHPNGQPSTSSDPYLGMSPNGHTSASPTAFSNSPTGQASTSPTICATVTSPAGHSSTSPSLYNTHSPNGHTQSQVSNYMVNPVTYAQTSEDLNNISPQSSGSASSLSNNNPEIIIPELSFYGSNNQQGSSAYYSEPVAQRQSLNCYSQGTVSSTPVEQNYLTPRSNGGLTPQPIYNKRHIASSSSRTPKIGPIRNGRKRCSSQNISVSPYSIDGSLLPPYSQPHRKSSLPSAPVSNNHTLPHRLSLCNPPPVYTSIAYPRTEETITGDSSAQTYTQLVQQSHLNNSSHVSHQPTYTTCAPSTSFLCTPQLANYSQAPSHSSSDISSKLPPFATISFPTSVPTSSLGFPQENDSQVSEVVNGSMVTNMLYRDENNSINVTASTSTAAANTSDQNTRRTSTRVFSAALQATCSLCNVTFASSGHLKRHLQAHGSNRRFKCHVCDCAYSRQDNLKKHLQAAHGINQQKTR